MEDEIKSSRDYAKKSVYLDVESKSPNYKKASGQSDAILNSSINISHVETSYLSEQTKNMADDGNISDIAKSKSKNNLRMNLAKQGNSQDRINVDTLHHSVESRLNTNLNTKNDSSYIVSHNNKRLIRKKMLGEQGSNSKRTDKNDDVTSAQNQKIDDLKNYTIDNVNDITHSATKFFNSRYLEVKNSQNIVSNSENNKESSNNISGRISKIHKSSYRIYDEHTKNTSEIKQEQKKTLQKKRNQQIFNNANVAAEEISNVNSQNTTEGKQKATIDNAARNVKIAAKSAAKKAFKKYWKYLLPIAGVFILFIFFLLIFCGGETGNVNYAVSFQTSWQKIVAVEKQFVTLEEDLGTEIDETETTHSGYDEYEYYLNGTKKSKEELIEELTHSNWMLAAYLGAKYFNYDDMDLTEELNEIFALYYQIETKEVTEERTRKVYDEEIEDYVDEKYEVKIYQTFVTQGDFDEILRSRLTDEQIGMYEVYLETSGNNPTVFSGATEYDGAEDNYSYTYSGAGNDLSDLVTYGDTYDIVMSTADGAALYTEGVKYLGKAYHWGGSSPSTGFDCSGFVCYTINQTIGNVGRTTANGLLSYCDTVSVADAQAGDLIFFQGTYATTGASHVGIYLGNGFMLHCGDPIKISSIKSDFWQSHFYTFGRLKDEYRK